MVIPGSTSRMVVPSTSRMQRAVRIAGGSVHGRYAKRRGPFHVCLHVPDTHPDVWQLIDGEVPLRRECLRREWENLQDVDGEECSLEDVRAVLK